MAHARKTWKRGTKNHRTKPTINHRQHLAGADRKATHFNPPGSVPAGHRHNAKEHRIYNIFRAKGYSQSHAWAATEGFAPHSIRQSGAFKTSSRTYSQTGRLAAAARHRK